LVVRKFLATTITADRSLIVGWAGEQSPALSFHACMVLGKERNKERNNDY